LARDGCRPEATPEQSRPVQALPPPAHQRGLLQSDRLASCGFRTGFTGGYGIVRAFVEQHRTRPDLIKVVKPPSVREVTGWICRHPDHVAERDTDRLRALLDRCPELPTAAELVRSFADMLTSLHGDRLGTWIAAAEQAETSSAGLLTARSPTGATAHLDHRSAIGERLW
jgi:hypothetical protein